MSFSPSTRAINKFKTKRGGSINPPLSFCLDLVCVNETSELLAEGTTQPLSIFTNEPAGFDDDIEVTNRF
jgi:hypothetical protein